MTDSRSLYDVLGVAPDADADAIKRAYKKLAAKHHPDRKSGNEARFKEASAAYEVLGDADRRQLYDTFGEASLRPGFDADRARAYAAAGGGSPTSDGRVDLEDLLRNMGGFGSFDFEDLGPFGAAAPRRSRAGQDLHAVVELGLEQAISGAEVELSVPRVTSCGDCHGQGIAPGTSLAACPACHGAGQREVTRGGMRMHATCTTCGGAGQQASACPACGGRGTRRSSKQLTVRIPPGADDGSTLRLKGKGAPSPHGGPAGDLIIETRVAPHPRVKRDGLDLSMKVPVTLEEAYLGADIEVPTFGGTVKLRVPEGSQSGTRLRLRGKGIARGDRRGDLYVELDVRLPPPGDETLARVLRRRSSPSPREGLSL